MARTVFSSTPVNAPFQPACGRAMMRACASANSTGPQSAVEAPMAMAGWSVTMASALGRSRQKAPGDDDIGRVDLVGGQQMARRHAHPGGDAAAVLRDKRLVVIRSFKIGAEVEAPVDAAGDAARAGEIAVADALACALSSRGDRTGSGLV